MAKSKSILFNEIAKRFHCNCPKDIPPIKDTGIHINTIIIDDLKGCHLGQNINNEFINGTNIILKNNGTKTE